MIDLRKLREHANFSWGNPFRNINFKDSKGEGVVAFS
jgi:hypothetical protein